MSTPNHTADHPHEEAALVRDHLAGLRTDLANRRTFLSYFRTALACFIAGLACIKFFGHPIIVGFGALLLPTGVIAMVQGIITYRKMSRAMRMEEARAEKDVST